MEFHYLDSDFAGLDESRLAICRADGPFGPWCYVRGQTLDTDRNVIALRSDKLGVFLLVQRPTEADVNAGSVLEVLLGLRPEDPIFDRDGNDIVNVADLVRENP